MPEPRLEKTLVANIVKAIHKEAGWRAVKTHGSIYQTGWPDILGCAEGHFFAIEVKLPGGKPTPLQAAQLDLWASALGITGCAHSVEEAIRIIKSGLGR